MFWKKIRSAEFKLLHDKITELERKINILDIDLSLLADKLTLAVKKRAAKKTEDEPETKSLYDRVLLKEK